MSSCDALHSALPQQFLTIDDWVLVFVSAQIDNSFGCCYQETQSSVSMFCSLDRVIDQLGDIGLPELPKAHYFELLVFVRSIDELLDIGPPELP